MSGSSLLAETCRYCEVETVPETLPLEEIAAQFAKSVGFVAMTAR